LNRVTEDEKAIEIGKVLGHWNPLGDGATAAKDFANVLHRPVETAEMEPPGSVRPARRLQTSQSRRSTYQLQSGRKRR